MAMQQLPHDFKEFLKLLNDHEVEYLVVGGYAVSYYGYPRPTGDIDIWIAIAPENASRMVQSLQEFGFAGSNLDDSLFLRPKSIVRMGVPPVKIEIMTDVSGVTFADCYARRTIANFEGVDVPLISFEDLRVNKAASGRLKDLNDLENLP